MYRFYAWHFGGDVFNARYAYCRHDDSSMDSLLMFAYFLKQRKLRNAQPSAALLSTYKG